MIYFFSHFLSAACNTDLYYGMISELKNNSSNKGNKNSQLQRGWSHTETATQCLYIRVTALCSSMFLTPFSLSAMTSWRIQTVMSIPGQTQ